MATKFIRKNGKVIPINGQGTQSHYGAFAAAGAVHRALIKKPKLYAAFGVGRAVASAADGIRHGYKTGSPLKGLVRSFSNDVAGMVGHLGSHVLLNSAGNAARSARMGRDAIRKAKQSSGISTQLNQPGVINGYSRRMR